MVQAKEKFSVFLRRTSGDILQDIATRGKGRFSGTVDVIKNAFNNFSAQPLLIKLVVIGVIFFCFYSIISNSALRFIIKNMLNGLSASISIILYLVLHLLKYFLILIILQYLFCKYIHLSIYRTLCWIGVIILINILDAFHVFGNFVSVSGELKSLYLSLSSLSSFSETFNAFKHSLDFVKEDFNYLTTIIHIWLFYFIT
jgi:hypothetical protein